MPYLKAFIRGVFMTRRYTNPRLPLPSPSEAANGHRLQRTPSIHLTGLKLIFWCRKQSLRLCNIWSQHSSLFYGLELALNLTPASDPYSKPLLLYNLPLSSQLLQRYQIILHGDSCLDLSNTLSLHL